MSGLMLLGGLRAVMADLDGGAAEDEMMRLGILEEKPVTGACGENCECACAATFPTTCYFLAADVEASLEAQKT